MPRVALRLVLVLVVGSSVPGTVMSQEAPRVDVTIEMRSTVIRVDSTAGGLAGLVQLRPPADQTLLVFDLRLFSEPALLVLRADASVRLSPGMMLTLEGPCPALATGHAGVEVEWGRHRSRGELTLPGPGLVACPVARAGLRPDNARSAHLPTEALHDG